MRFLKGYKGVALIYLFLTIFNVIWIINYDKPTDMTQVQKERNVVFNA